METGWNASGVVRGTIVLPEKNRTLVPWVAGPVLLPERSPLGGGCKQEAGTLSPPLSSWWWAAAGGAQPRVCTGVEPQCGVGVRAWGGVGNQVEGIYGGVGGEEHL